MFGFFSRGSGDRGIDRGRGRERRRDGGVGLGRTGADRHRRLPRLEELEVRLTLSTSTWTGAGSDNHWSTPANWSDNAVPAAGADLVFPTGVVNQSALDDLPNTPFASITIEAAGYTLTGTSLNLTGGITATYAAGVSSSDITTTALGGGTISVAAGGELDLGGSISGTAGLSLSGGGTLALQAAASNTYSGITRVVGATLLLSQTAGATAVPGSLIIGDGTAASLVRATAADQIADAATVTINAAGTLDLNDNGDTIGGLTLTGGAVTTGAGTLTLGGNVTVSNSGGSGSSIAGNLALGTATRTFTVGNTPGTTSLTVSATISGTNVGIRIIGGGTVLFQGNNTYGGTTTISGSGTALRVDGTIGVVQVAAGSVLGGSGTVGNVTSTGGSISPGDSPGVLRTGNLTLNSTSSLVAELDGTAPGNGTTGYDQVVASGPVSLGGAVLSLSLGGDYTPVFGDKLTIIDNGSGSAVTGNFANLGEAAIVNVSGFPFRITYLGGPSQNDVVLSALATATVGISAPASSTYGQSVTFTAQVAGNQGVPTGAVAFYDGNPTTGGTRLGTNPVDAQGVASFSTTGLNVAGSPHQVFAVYDPDATSNYASSTTVQPAAVTVSPAALTVTADAQSMTYGGAVPNLTFTSTGLVNGDTAGSALSGTLMTTATSQSSVGTYPITQGTLTASPNYTLSFIPGALTITPAPLTITATSLTNPFGAPLPTFTVSFTGFVNGDTPADLTAFPTASTTATSTSPPGTYPINLTGGSATNYTITNVSGTLAITQAPTTTTLTRSVNVSVFGQLTTITAQVSPTSPSTGNPTGTVTFLVDDNPFRTVAVDPVTGQASFTTSVIPFGIHTVTAAYSGDTNFQPSQTTVSAVQQVTSAGTSPSVTTLPVRDRHGRLVAVLIRTQVAPIAPGVGVPTGLVTYYRNGRTFRARLLHNGTAELRVKPVKVLNQFYFVRYGGDPNFQPSLSNGQVFTVRNLG